MKNLVLTKSRQCGLTQTHTAQILSKVKISCKSCYWKEICIKSKKNKICSNYEPQKEK